MLGWVQDAPLLIDTVQFLNSNEDMHRWKTGRDEIILINYFNLESSVDHSNNYQKYLSSAVLKDIG